MKTTKKYSLDALQDNTATRNKEVTGDINK
jgi:hypothetical protein